MNESFKYRCSICPTVSDPSIADTQDDYKPFMNYFPDPKNSSQFICGDCFNEYQETMRDWAIVDGVKNEDFKPNVWYHSTK